MDLSFKPNPRMIGKHPQLEPLLPEPAPTHIADHHEECPVRRGRFQPCEFLNFGRRHPVISIKPEDPAAGGLIQGYISGIAEIVAPIRMNHLRPKSVRYFDGVIRRSGVHHDDLVGKTLDAFQAISEVMLFIFNDHAYGKGIGWSILGTVFPAGHRWATPFSGNE
jgi:hypothetical protein